MNRRNLIIAGGLTSIGMLRPASAQTLPSIRVTTVPVDAGAEVYYAADLGFFTKAGLAVSVDSVSNGNAILNAVVTGSVDVGYSNILSLEVAFKKGAPVTIIAPAAINSDDHPTNFIYVSKASAIHSARDLEGKTVAASPLGSMAQWSVVAWMEKNGGDPTTLRFIEMPFPDMVPALTAGRIDAAFVVNHSERWLVRQRDFWQNHTQPLGSGSSAEPGFHLCSGPTLIRILFHASTMRCE